MTTRVASAAAAVIALAVAGARAEPVTVSGTMHGTAGPVRGEARAVVLNPGDGGWEACAAAPRRFRELLERGPEVLASAEADARGEFILRFEPRPGVDVELNATGHRRRAWPAEPDRGAPQPSRHGHRLDRAAPDVRLTARDADGGWPVEGVLLRWRAGGTGPVRTARTDRAGRASVEAHACFLAEASGFAPVVSAPVAELTLRAAPRVEVQVLRDGGAAEAELELRAGLNVEHLQTDGGFALIDEVPAPFTVRARGPGAMAEARVVGAGAQRLELELRPAARLRLAVALERSESLQVTIGEDSHRLLGFQADADGGFLFELQQGTWLLRSFNHAAGGRQRVNVAKWVTLDGDRTESLDVWMLPLQVAVVDDAGAAQPAELTVQSDLELKCGMGSGFCGPLLPLSQRGRTLDGGSLHWVPQAGEYRVTAVSLDGGEFAQGTAKVPGPPLRLELGRGQPPRVQLPRAFITGTVRDEKGRPADLQVCAMLGNHGSCHPAVDGGFAVEVFVPGVSHRVSVNDRRPSVEWTSDPVLARPGEDLALIARPWKARQVSVVGPRGKAVPLPKWLGRGGTMDVKWSRREELALPGFIPIAFDAQTIGPQVQLASLPLGGTAVDAAGRPAEGAAVSLLCDSAANERPVKWARYTSDVGGGDSWTYWDDGVQCIVATTRVDAKGRFGFAEVRSVFSQVELRRGAKVRRVPYRYGEPLDLVLP